MAGTYTPAKGTTIARGAAIIPQVSNITVFDLNMPIRDNTHLASVAQESAPTIPNHGTINFNVLLNPANTEHAALISDYIAGTVSTWTTTLADAGAATIVGSMFVESIRANGAGPRDSIQAAVTLRYQETMTFTP